MTTAAQVKPAESAPLTARQAQAPAGKAADTAEAAGSVQAPGQTKAPANPRRKKILLGALGLGVIAALGWGAQWWFVGRFIESTDDAYLQADSMTVAPKVGGYVTEVLVRDNETVTVGQPLVRLDARQYQAAYDEAQATVLAREADVTRAQAELSQHSASIAQVRAELDSARANAAYSAGQVKRYVPLVATGAETDERLAELRNASARADASLRSSEASLQASERQTDTLAAALAQAKAQLTVAQASARKADLDLADTVVKSTLSGRVGDRAVRVGQFAQPGTRLLTVVPVQNVYLTANFKETQVGHMRPGQPVTVHVDALPGEPIHGVVDSLSPGTGAQFALLPAQNATGNFTKIVQRVPVRIRLDVPESLRTVLLPGLSVTADVDTHRSAPAKPAKQAARPGQQLSLSAPLDSLIGPLTNAASTRSNGGAQRG
ncbi:HlyD family secretion protein [Pandoraea apista]|uniref:HlyD family secretion protein n=1 Tax=Pandoraea apista TaxID=93218 RepID=A0ABX9ZM68_9BURK|nr:HlyD family secretion protein [Pandoraea apista]PTE00242.1 multidrug ABC transporter permease [Pandoraea apista]RRJ32578.1 HlyD family secretion protein [Pandoraea apista]RRJ74297.1 HlyD family secretion protein [Pandoraea apista]RSD09733.1 HlyD family secretion protein [Pandoraea apista]RSK78699.1 HlyD family secretion protein [Pandoraea apista]